MTQDLRSPQAFVLDNTANETAKVVVKGKTKSPILTFDAEPEQNELLSVPRSVETSVPRSVPWLGFLLSAIAALIIMWVGLSITSLVDAFFVRSPWLGWLALAFAGIVALATLAIIAREIIGLLRLNKIEGLQEKSARAINLDEQKSASETITELEAIYASRQDMAWGIAQLKTHRKDILDPSDRVRLAETLLMLPLDEAAHKIIARRSRRVTLLTTVTPAAALDVIFVAVQNIAMLREIATLYGGKPSTLATLKLARMIITHLAVAGGLSLSDSFIQHFIGKGLLGRLSARFGEGAVNGILTARIGLAACSLCRPIPKKANTRETLSGLLREVLTFGTDKNQTTETTKTDFKALK